MAVRQKDTKWRPCTNLGDRLMRIMISGFFHKSNPPSPLICSLKPFWIWRQIWRYSTFKSSALWTIAQNLPLSHATVQNLLKHYGTQYQIYCSSALWTIEWNQVRIREELYPMWIHEDRTVSTCTRPRIHVVVFFTCMWVKETCTGFGFSPWATTQNMAMRYRPYPRIWLFAIGHNAEHGFAL